PFPLPMPFPMPVPLPLPMPLPMPLPLRLQLPLPMPFPLPLPRNPPSSPFDGLELHQPRPLDRIGGQTLRRTRAPSRPATGRQPPPRQQCIVVPMEPHRPRELAIDVRVLLGEKEVRVGRDHRRSPRIGPLLVPCAKARDLQVVTRRRRLRHVGE